MTSIFIVYAHNHKNGVPTNSHYLRSIFNWLKVIRSRTISDKAPLLVQETREGDDAAVHNILSNQYFLLPFLDSHSTVVISSVDAVVVFGSQLLKTYYEDRFTAPYAATHKEIFNQWRTETNVTTKALHSRIRDCVEEQYGNPECHHVLTELAFLDIRKNLHGTSCDITPLSRNNAAMYDYLFLWGSTDLIVARDVKITKTQQLHGLFFKLLQRI